MSVEVRNARAAFLTVITTRAAAEQTGRVIDGFREARESTTCACVERGVEGGALAVVGFDKHSRGIAGEAVNAMAAT